MWGALFQCLAAVLASEFTSLLRCIQVALRALIHSDGSWVTLAPKFQFNLCSFCICCVILSVIIAVGLLIGELSLFGCSDYKTFLVLMGNPCERHLYTHRI